MNKLTFLGLVGTLLVSIAPRSNESIVNHNLEQLISIPEPIKTELTDSLKIEMLKIKEPPKYDGSKRLDRETLNDFVDFIYNNMEIKDVIDKKFVKSIVEIESNRYVYSKSRVGARGLMQVMPQTWDSLEKELDFYKEAFNPQENLKIGIKYLNQLDYYCEKNYSGWNDLSIKNKQIFIAAAYNGGIGRLMKNNWDISKMPEETQFYIKEIERINP